MTAESAVVMSVLVAFTMALVWGLLVVAARIQCVDAARTGARAAARQDPAAAVVEVTRRAAPRGARVTVGRSGDQVRVTVVARPPVLSGLPFEVREEAVALAEETVGTGTGTGADTGEGPGTSRGTGAGTGTGRASGAGAGAGPGAVAGAAREPRS
nr:TadE family type IV pilus minor pilin [Streptomyces cellostaticus]